MIILKYIVLALSLICVVSCSKHAKDKHGNENESVKHFGNMSTKELQRLKHGMNYVYYLSPEEIQGLAIKAERGDKDAAFKIYEHYNWAEYDKEKALYWVKKAAENGHVVAQYNLAIMYLKILNISREQGIYWLKKAAENGDDKAKKELKKLNKTEER